MKKIDTSFIDPLSEQAKTRDRQRINFNFHEYAEDRLQRMILALEPGTYIQPHKHENPNKREVFIILRGKIVVIEYNTNGGIKDHYVLDAKTGNYGVEIEARTWHSLISLEAGSVLYELKDGPYDPLSDKDFANWAPEEGDSECAAFLEKTLAELRISE